MRDDFTVATKETLAKRVGYRCSRPGCGRSTTGPQVDSEKSINVGVACHITAASPGGPRYDPALTSEERSGPDNGIWLCQTCGKLVDNDSSRYTAETLREWKLLAELAALQDLETPESPDRPKAE